MKTLVLSILAIATFGNLANAQVEGDTRPCGVHDFDQQVYEKMEEVFAKHPEYRIQHEEMLNLIQNSKVEYYNGNAKIDSIAYVIPVVFHILHDYGNENISDAQVYDAMRVINEEWQHEDPDSVDITPSYKNIASGAPIEFRLASIDPFGNCTNGIEHIYTHETYIGDAMSKVNQWDRSRYMNIWVVKVVGASGAAAYATPPEGTDGMLFWRDGVVSGHTYVGSIGTSSPGVEATLTHEIGHMFNLCHPWACGQSDPGQVCGDDGVSDTPITTGYSPGSIACNWTTLEDLHSCGDLTLPTDNAQNYMDYAYCDRMFTEGQMQRAMNAAISISGQRNNLWQPETLDSTGTSDAVVTMPQTALTVPLCTPVADFNANKKRVCIGSTVQFTDHSWNAVIEDRTWTFEDGTPSTSTGSIANVVFNTPGWKTVTLTVNNATGSDTKTMTDYIYVSPDWADFNGPASLDIEGGQYEWFLVENPEANWAKFQVMDGVGRGGSRAFKLNNYKDISGADPFTAEGRYNDRLGKSVDRLVTPSFDLRNTTNVKVSFYYSYASNATQAADIEESLKVYSSRNCGESWTTRKSILGAQLVTGGYAGNTDYAPTNDGMWEYAEFTYTVTSQDNTTRFLFEFEASDLSSNLYIDDINVTGTLSLEAAEIKDLELTVFPNPTKGEAINVRYTAQNEAVEFILRDMTGKVISTETVNTTNSTVTHQIEGSSNLPSAPYFLEVRSGDYSTTKKIVVL